MNIREKFLAHFRPGRTVHAFCTAAGIIVILAAIVSLEPTVLIALGLFFGWLL